MTAFVAWGNGSMKTEYVFHRDAQGPKFQILELQNPLERQKNIL